MSTAKRRKIHNSYRYFTIAADEYGLPKNSVVLLEQLRTIDKKRLREKIGSFDNTFMNKLDDALKISVGLR